jgi:hypothetical protein
MFQQPNRSKPWAVIVNIHCYEQEVKLENYTESDHRFIL